VVKTEEIIESTKHNINYFEEIGWLDPYPTNIAEQKKAMQVNVMNLNLNVLAYDLTKAGTWKTFPPRSSFCLL